ncbi:ATP-binding protein [Pseudomonas sp. Marseille-Q5115]|uniref:ATP-binding protein n=1 Tax=Pseudomonas sp. Marseille-Q5115 TaxID=2866593 RepID=UPI001CE3E900|nr:ATP-binding protein [Pseudomonas sp. Marseille-Q5115]
MSLRVRLMLILGGAFVLIWALAAAWMFRDLRGQMMFSLDQRLVASARMVAGLVQQLPQPLRAQDGERISADQSSIPDGMACKVSSLRGEILATSHQGVEAELGEEGGGFHDQIIDGEHWRSFTLSHGDVRITTADRQQEREALNQSVLLAASVPVLVALLGSLGVLWLGVGQGLAPLNRIRDALTRRSPDALEPLLVRPLPAELRPLVETQNQLFVRIGQAIERERRLTDDAAHELRSPLTAVKTHLQVARMTDGAAREAALANAEEGADRLHRTLDQLLLLARVEGRLAFEENRGCAVADVARLAINDTTGDARRIETDVEDGAAQVPLGVPLTLAVAALRNLLDNALRHGGSERPVQLDVCREGGHALFRVRDRGPGIKESELAHLTERFWRSSHSQGCGLGLAIVQAIVQRCQGQLDFHPMPDGLQVDLRLPLGAVAGGE